jgi:hypothetical protein
MVKRRGSFSTEMAKYPYVEQTIHKPFKNRLIQYLCCCFNRNQQYVDDYDNSYDSDSSDLKGDSYSSDSNDE